MRTKLVPGATIEAATPAEVGEIVRAMARGQESEIRTGATIVLDSNGNGQDEIYTVPAAMTFYLRRVSINLSTASDPSTGAVALNVAGKYIQYLRSGQFIEYAIPVAPTAIAQVPGVQTWSSVEGPILRNLETFEVKAVGLTANASLDVNIQGLLVEKR